MNQNSLFVFSVFLIYFLTFIVKGIVQFQNTRVNPFKLGKGDKPFKLKAIENLIVLSNVFLMFIVIIHTFQLFQINRFYSSDFSVYFGAVVLLSGLTLSIYAMFSMRESWRMGVDDKKAGSLVKSGIFKVSRNPVFVGYNLMLLGLFLVYPDLLTLAVMLVNSAIIHVQILQEEQFLVSVYGDEYTEYQKQAPRYLVL